MLLLDCYDEASALTSLAAAIGVDPPMLREALLAFDEAEIDQTSEDAIVAMPRLVLEGLGTTREEVARRLGGTVYFHGSRTVDPESFARRGILPLDLVVEEIWTELGKLLRDQVTMDEWASFRRWVETDGGGHYGELYRMKTGGELHFGPFGTLVRTMCLDPSRYRQHDYLRCPEIVEDIAICHGGSLLLLFMEASHPCLVMFRDPNVPVGAIDAALWFVRTTLQEQELGFGASYAYDGRGIAIEPDNVIDVLVR